MDVTVYTTYSCPGCRMVKEYLEHLGVDFKEIPVERNPKAWQTLVARSGHQGVPVTVVGDEIVAGFDRRRFDGFFRKIDDPGAGP